MELNWLAVVYAAISFVVIGFVDQGQTTFSRALFAAAFWPAIPLMVFGNWIAERLAK